MVLHFGKPKLNTMKTMERMRSAVMVLSVMLLGAVTMTSCDKDDDDDKMSSTFNYAFNTGQVGAGTAYSGSHPTDYSASMMVEELDDDKSRISVTLNNTVDGQMYMLHAHDAADPATTPNGTPYNETPNSAVFVQMIEGNGASVTATQEVNFSYEYITETYSGFFVSHDPTQAISTVDLTTYLIVGGFAR